MLLRAAQQRAPRDSGALASGLSEAFDPQPMGLVSALVAVQPGVARYIAVSALNAGRRIATTRKAAQAAGLSFRRYRYARSGRRFRNKAFNATEVVFKYRNGPLKNKRTKGWLTGVVRSRPVKREIEGLLNVAAQEIEAAWQR